MRPWMERRMSAAVVNFLYTIVYNLYTSAYKYSIQGNAMLERLFTSRVRTKLLAKLLFSAGRQFHLREIAREIGASPVHAGKEIKRLASLGLVRERKVGNLTLFQANEGAPIFPELKRIFLKTEVFPESVKGHLAGLSIEFAFIFGSFAKNMESERSDIDLFVIGDVDEGSILRMIQKLESGLGREINYILWKRSVFERRASEGHHLLKSISKNPVVMIIGDEAELRRIIDG